MTSNETPHVGDKWFSNFRLGRTDKSLSGGKKKRASLTGLGLSSSRGTDNLEPVDRYLLSITSHRKIDLSLGLGLKFRNAINEELVFPFQRSDTSRLVEH